MHGRGIGPPVAGLPVLHQRQFIQRFGRSDSIWSYTFDSGARATASSKLMLFFMGRPIHFYLPPYKAGSSIGQHPIAVSPDKMCIGFDVCLVCIGARCIVYNMPAPYWP